MNWYTLRVISGKEKKIRDAILYEVSLTSFSEDVGDVLVPSENIVEMRDGKKKVRERVFFPGYLLVRLEMNKETKWRNVVLEIDFGFCFRTHFGARRTVWAFENVKTLPKQGPEKKPRFGRV